MLELHSQSMERHQNPAREREDRSRRDPLERDRRDRTDRRDREDRTRTRRRFKGYMAGLALFTAAAFGSLCAPTHSFSHSSHMGHHGSELVAGSSNHTHSHAISTGCMC